MAPAVRLREAVALAGRFPLLAGVTLEVGEGEIVHLRGPNGAGKTSLLRLCCGLLRVRSGEASVLGHDLVADNRAVRRDVALLGHSAYLYEELTPAENLRFALRAAGAEPARAPAALERLGITGRLAGLPVGQLSAGQRRRAALAVLVARGPRLWLLDEPHAGLDPEGRALLDTLVADARAGGATIMLSSHEHDRAAAMADRIVEIAGGRVTSGQFAPAAPAPPGAGATAAVPVTPAQLPDPAGSTRAVHGAGAAPVGARGEAPEQAAGLESGEAVHVA
jgi:heme ABC exporter ATP-binding subunit CcmA